MGRQTMRELRGWVGWPLRLAALVAVVGVTLPSAGAMAQEPGAEAESDEGDADSSAAEAKDDDASEGRSAQPDDDGKEAASEAFKQGREAYMKDRYDEALEAFRRSYAAHASPNSRLMIAKCLAFLSHPKEAFEELQATIREAEEAADPKYAKTGESAREELNDLRKRVAVVRVRFEGGAANLPADARVLVNGEELERDRWESEIALMPGEASIRLQTSAGVDDHPLTLAAGSETDVTLAVAETAPADDGAAGTMEADGSWFVDNQRTMAYVVGGVGAAGMIVFGVFGGLTLSRFNDLDERCPGGACPAGTQADIDSGKTYQTVANVGVIVGAVGLTAGVLLWVLHPDILGSGDEGAGTSASLELGAGSLSLKGRF